jgi:predicted MFS family arabinose efflux permease
VYAIVHAETGGWTSATTLGFFVLSAILLASFVVIEMRSTAPLVRLSIFKIRSLTTANITMFLAMSAMFAMFFFNTLYIQRVLGYAPLKAGFSFLPFTAGIMVSAGLASALAPRIGVRPVAAVGMLLSAVGLLLLTQLPVDGSYVTNVLPAMILTSLGMGAVFMPLTLVATTGLDNEDQGLASGLFNTSQQIGGALGLAVLSTLAADRTSSYLQGLGHAPSAQDQAAGLVEGFQVAFTSAAILVAFGAVLLAVLLRAKDVANVNPEQGMVPAG